MLRINKEYLLILPLCDNSEPFLVVLCDKLLRLHLKNNNMWVASHEFPTICQYRKIHPT